MDPRREANQIQSSLGVMGRPKLPPEDPFDADVKERFFSYVRRTPECWWWTGGCSSNGYGSFALRHWKGHGKITAHAYSFLIHHGEVPAGQQIRHTCDNSLCVNPNHMLTGTHKDNADDRESRGRGRPHNAMKTHCPQGHEFSWMSGRRVCRTCRRAADKRWRDRRGPKT